MKISLVIFLLLGASLFFVLADEDVEDQESSKTQWQNILDWAQGAMQDIEQTLTNLTLSIPRARSEEEARIRETAATLTATLDESLEEIRRLARLSGVDPEECIGSLPERGTGLIANFTITGIQCVTDKLQEAADILQVVGGALQKMNSTLVGAIGDFDKCMHSSNPGKAALCGGLVSVIAALRESQAVTTIAKQISTVTVLVATSQMTVGLCLVNTVGNTPNMVSKMIEKTLKCVRNKITEENSQKNNM